MKINFLPFFSTLPNASIERFGALLNRVEYVDDQIISIEGDADVPVYFVLEGSVRVFSASREGREQVIVNLMPGDGINLPSAFSQDHRAPASVAAVGKTVLLRISQVDLQRAVKTDPDLAMVIIGHLSERLQHLTRLVHDVALRPVRGRLAKFLLQQHLAQQQGSLTASFTQEEIANQIGTSREVVSRSLRDFIREGMVKVERQKIIILKPEMLSREAPPSGAE